MKKVGVGFGVDFDGVSDVHEGEIALENIHEDPDGVGIGDGETLGRAPNEKLPGAHEPFHNFAGDRSDNWYLCGGLHGRF